jgi:hypothetical protein
LVRKATQLAKTQLTNASWIANWQEGGGINKIGKFSAATHAKSDLWTLRNGESDEICIKGLQIF